MIDAMVDAFARGLWLAAGTPEGSSWRLVVGIGGTVVLLALVTFLLLRRKTPAAGPVAGESAVGVGWYLAATEGTLSGRRFEIGPDGLRIGRDPRRCQVVYQADTLSREHALLEPGEDGLRLFNLSSTNRTYLNGEAIAEAIVQPGDRIRISKVVFEVERP